MALCAGWRKCVAESAADLWSQRSHWRRPVDQRLAVRPPLFRSDRSHLYRRLSCRLVLRSLVVPSTSWDLNDSVCPFSRWWCCHLVVRAAPSIPGNCRWRKRIWSSWFHAATPSVLHTHTHTHTQTYLWNPGEPVPELSETLTQYTTPSLSSNSSEAHPTFPPRPLTLPQHVVWGESGANKQLKETWRSEATHTSFIFA